MADDAGGGSGGGGRGRPIGARALEAAIALGDRDAVDKILDSGACWFWWISGCCGVYPTLFDGLSMYAQHTTHPPHIKITHRRDPRRARRRIQQPTPPPTTTTTTNTNTTSSGCLHYLADHPDAVPHVLPLLLARGARLDLLDEVHGWVLA